jgi:imidazolonepropionase-like amidohydrolase
MAKDAAAIQRAGGIVGIGSHGNYPGIGTHWEMQAHAAGGMTPREILRAATLGSATTIGRAGQLGSLERGKLADFVVLSANPLDDIANALSIRHVVKDGRVYDAETLDEVWPRQRPAARSWWFESAEREVPPDPGH